ncbi:aminopeptidase P N-terminal domain-containing protein [Echinicola marina]|uniref:aminopeptidase P N-terminal domain-containing protein n=1 Tax=Echinicola marina TaxID=2859768 RepID=UPI001CF6F6EB|nr:aminopeptidase P N-terminal domain-containing protein [Echinicola marina]UCS94781.1 aminopeptidase P N-terminal domain-containing protein [Echinicola marina]
MSKRKILLAILICLGINTVMAQSYFDDGLDKSFHQGRRDALREMLPDNSAAVIFTAPVKNRSNDVDFVYHPNTDFFYLTGYREPNAVLVVFSEPRLVGGKMIDEVIYVQERDENAEMWNGKRLGVEGVKEKLGFEHVFLNSQFSSEAKVDFGELDKIMTFNLKGIEESNANKDMMVLQADFKAASNYPEQISKVTNQMYDLIKSTDLENSANVAQVIGRYRKYYPEVENDKLLIAFADADTPEKRMEIANNLPETKIDVAALPQIMTELRGVKTPEEIEMLKNAIRISAIGQVEVMKALKPGISEREVQGIHEFVYKRYGAEAVGYPSIVGAGQNGCILHYISNDLRDPQKRLMLMDLGAEWRGYTADVTRTIPISGKFTKEEKAIYDLVFKAQEEAMYICKPGTEFGEVNKVAQRIINEGLAELGVIVRGQRHRYFPHGTSHHLGLDVHDRGTYGPLKEGMVLTVEPGIYIPEGSDCDEKWWNIAVRIEDDVLITQDGFVNLSADAPRSSEDIEAMMEKPSILEDWVLPEL